MNRTGKTIVAICAAALVGGAALAAGGMGRGDHGARMGARMFERFDANGDGAVTRAEVDAAHAERLAAVDANKDGSVDLEELTAAMTARAAKQAERIMKRADANSDGLLGPDEYGPRHGDMFERLDADKDGVITKAEAEEARHKFREWRRHGDGEGRGGFWGGHHGPRSD